MSALALSDNAPEDMPRVSARTRAEQAGMASGQSAIVLTVQRLIFSALLLTRAMCVQVPSSHAQRHALPGLVHPCRCIQWYMYHHLVSLVLA
jgi:hypothetical protein